jgi:hypothetical protein
MENESLNRRSNPNSADSDMDERDFTFPEKDRRRSKRFGIQAPAVAKVRNREIWAFTKDISTCGAYLCVGVDEDLRDLGTILDIVIKVPPTIRSAKPCFITGRGKIIRIEHEQWDTAGIAVEIRDFAIQTEPHGEEQDDIHASDFLCRNLDVA